MESTTSMGAELAARNGSAAGAACRFEYDQRLALSLGPISAQA